MIQMVMAKGGYENVIACKLWMETAHQLFLPKACTTLSVQMRSNYENYLLPIELDYQQQLNTTNEPSSKRPKYSDARNSASPGEPVDYSKFVNDDAFQVAGAVACGFNPQALMPEEIIAFPEFAYTAQPKDRTTYLDIRNFILLKWTSTVEAELDLNVHIIDPLHCQFGLHACCDPFINKQLLGRVFCFLDTCGAINCGVFKTPNVLKSRMWIPGRSHSTKPKSIVVVGAGLAGLTVARQLQYFGHTVIVVEARERTGGRVFTDHSFDGAPVDLGAMLVTGAIAHPAMMISKQLGEPCHLIRTECPLYWCRHESVDQELDESIEKKFYMISELAVSKKKKLLKIPEIRQVVASEAIPDEKSKREEILKWQAPPENLTAVTAPASPFVLPNITPTRPMMNFNLSEPQFQTEVLNSDIVARDCVQCATSVVAHVPTMPTESSIIDAIAASLESSKRGSEARQLAETSLNNTEQSIKYDVDLQSAIDWLTAEEARKGDWGSFSIEEQALMGWHMANLEYANSTLLRNVSNTNWDQDDEYSFAGSHYMLRNGFCVLTNGLKEGLDVKLGCVVDCIDSRNGAKLTYTQHNKKHTLEADIVVVTVPLGVLKSNAIEFKPPLPSWKQKSISRLGYGNLNKVVLEFSSIFWNEEYDVSGRVVHETDHPETRLPFPPRDSFTFEDRRGEFFTCWALNRNLLDNRPILVFIISGNAANNIEKCQDSQVIDCLVHVLRGMYDDVPDPIRGVVTKWKSDPFACGSYSYVAIGADGRDYDSLAESVNDKIFFAGEATSRQHPATTGGAFLTGLREASKIAGVHGRISQVARKVENPDLKNLFEKCWYSLKERDQLMSTDHFFEHVKIRSSSGKARSVSKKKKTKEKTTSNEVPRLSARQVSLKNKAIQEFKGKHETQDIDHSSSGIPFNVQCSPIPDNLLNFSKEKRRPGAQSHISKTNLELLFNNPNKDAF